ncbi:hypothetical protein TNCV_4136831 [Trichonephila clavipes]|nr:hypothetical protein TNCV_4136831 [Trichonephila clavipes]
MTPEPLPLLQTTTLLQWEDFELDSFVSQPPGIFSGTRTRTGVTRPKSGGAAFSIFARGGKTARADLAPLRHWPPRPQNIDYREAE